MKTTTVPLDPAGVDRMAEEIQRFFEDQGLRRQEAARVRLTMETLLLRLLEREERPETVLFSLGKGLQRLTVRLRYAGAPFDPAGTQPEEAWNGRLLTTLGLAPTWGYRSGWNTVRIRILKPSGKSSLLRLAAAVALAAVLGAAGTLLPEAVRTGITDALLTPVFDAFLGLITTFAGPMIFMTIAAGVFGIGDTAALGRMGKTLFVRYLATAFLVSAMTLAVVRPFLSLAAGKGGGESQLRQISELLFGILSRNPIQPFLDANALQIIVLGVFTGVILLILGERVRTVQIFIEECGTALQMMMDVVCRLIPLFVFVSLLRQIWSGAMGQLLGLWKPFLLYLLVNGIFLAVLTAEVSLRARVSPVLLLKKEIPATLVAFTTASSMASYSTCQEACTKRLGIGARLFDFSFPLGLVIYMPSGVTTFALLAGYLAEVYQIPVSPSWFVLAWILAAFLSVAVPPTPGAMLTCYGILLVQLGIPMEGMLLAVTLNVVLDFFMTAMDVLTLQLDLVSQGKLLRMLDEETLRAP